MHVPWTLGPKTHLRPRPLLLQAWCPHPNVRLPQPASTSVGGAQTLSWGQQAGWGGMEGGWRARDSLLSSTLGDQPEKTWRSRHHCGRSSAQKKNLWSSVGALEGRCMASCVLCTVSEISLKLSQVSMQGVSSGHSNQVGLIRMLGFVHKRRRKLCDHTVPSNSLAELLSPPPSSPHHPSSSPRPPSSPRVSSAESQEPGVLPLQLIDQPQGLVLRRSRGLRTRPHGGGR